MQSGTRPMSMPVLLAIAVLIALAGGAIGYLAGRGPPATRNLPEACEIAVRDVHREMEFVATVCDISLTAALGERIEWPEPIPAGFSPGDVEAAAERAVRECPGVAEGAPHLDCDEFPCLVWMRGDATLAGCAAFDGRVNQYGTRRMNVGGKRIDTTQWVIAPDGWPETGRTENWEIRRDFRLHVHEALAREAWEGR